MFGRNSFRMVPAGPTRNAGMQSPLRAMADGGRVSAFDVIGEELPKWWKSDETADLRKGLRQTGLGAAYTFGPGLPMLPMVGPELYDAFFREEEERKSSPTMGSFSWLESKLGRDLHDPVEEEMAVASGLAQMTPLVKSIPSLYRGAKALPGAASRGMEKTSDWLGQKFSSLSNAPTSEGRRGFIGQAAGLGAGAALAGTGAAKLAKTIDTITTPGVIPEVATSAAPKAVTGAARAVAPALDRLGYGLSNLMSKFRDDDTIRLLAKKQYDKYLGKYGPDHARTVEMDDLLKSDNIDEMAEVLDIGISDARGDDLFELRKAFPDINYTKEYFGDLSPKELEELFGKGTDVEKSIGRLLESDLPSFAYELDSESDALYSILIDYYSKHGKFPPKDIEHPLQILDNYKNIPAETLNSVIDKVNPRISQFVTDEYSRLLNDPDLIEEMIASSKNNSSGMASGGPVISPAVKAFLDL